MSLAEQIEMAEQERQALIAVKKKTAANDPQEKDLFNNRKYPYYER